MSMNVTKARFWIATLVMVSAVACVLSLLIATLGAAAGAVSGEHESGQPSKSSSAGPQTPAQTYEGVITDSRCGARHSATMGQTAAFCTRACIHDGERFALVDGDRSYFLQGNSAALSRSAGERVKLLGTLQGNTISVVSVAAPAS
jgi:hypothetical protein